MEEGGEGKGGWDGSVTYHRVVDLPICIYLLGKKRKLSLLLYSLLRGVYLHM